MRHKPFFFTFAGVELFRYYFLTQGALLAVAAQPQLLRLVAAPNLLFAAAFFFLGMNPDRYSVYRPLIIVGKAVSVFAAAVGLPALVSSLGEAGGGTGIVASVTVGAVGIWDVLTAAYLLFVYRGKTGEPGPVIGSHEATVETVEAE
ncbi:MAG: hypothetical protein E4H20_01480 [Spirochaetales bacterium]|nr:MAG: hypothetical protein E4H20_01480 [Spirochaetales bacterium]